MTSHDSRRHIERDPHTVARRRARARAMVNDKNLCARFAQVNAELARANTKVRARGRTTRVDGRVGANFVRERPTREARSRARGGGRGGARIPFRSRRDGGRLTTRDGRRGNSFGRTRLSRNFERNAPRRARVRDVHRASDRSEDAGGGETVVVDGTARGAGRGVSVANRIGECEKAATRPARRDGAGSWQTTRAIRRRLLRKRRATRDCLNWWKPRRRCVIYR